MDEMQLLHSPQMLSEILRLVDDGLSSTEITLIICLHRAATITSGSRVYFDLITKGIAPMSEFYRDVKQTVENAILFHAGRDAELPYKE